MKGFLGLASDFIEKMANPAFGVQINESYSLRLAQLLADDKEASMALTHMSDLDGQDLNLLTTDGWLWLLGWMKSHGNRPPDNFLHSLFDTTNYLALRLRVVETVTATVNREAMERWRETRFDVYEFPESWLRTRMRRAVAVRMPEDRRERGDDAWLPEQTSVVTAVAESFELATLLLQVGDETAIMAARSLLAHRWIGAESLQSNIIRLFGGLDEETRREWLSMLGLEQGREG